jgi:hypothetical protein
MTTLLVLLIAYLLLLLCVRLWVDLSGIDLSQPETPKDRIGLHVWALVASEPWRLCRSVAGHLLGIWREMRR